MKPMFSIVLPSVAAAGLALYAGLPTAPAVVDDPILTVHPPSLATLKVATATTVQDIRPRVGQRATNLDGMLRARPMQRMAVAGNPYENVWRAAMVDHVRLDTGTYQLEEVDIALPAVMPWICGRSFNCRQETSGSSHRDSAGPMGANWQISSQPEILLYDDPTSAANDIVYVFTGAAAFLEYKRTDATSSTFRSRNGSAGVIAFTAAAGGEPETYTLVDQHGTEATFFGFDNDADPAKGQIWKLVDAEGSTAFVGDDTTASTAITNGYTATGRISKAYDSSSRRFSYSYDGTTDRLTGIVAETKTGGTWASPTGVTEVASVAYEYYGNESYGDTGDLKLVEIETPLTDSGVTSTRKQLYRYWEGAFHASTNPGHPHALKYIVDSEGLRQEDWNGSAFDESFLSLSNENLEPYASAYFEYDASHRIVEAFFDGECGCSGGANGTYLFEYETNGSFSDDTGAYDEEWKTRTIVQRPDGSYLTQAFDEAHGALDRVITDADPDNTVPVPSRWVTHVVRDANGEVSQISTPANITGYTHSTGAVTTSTSVGLVRDFTRTASGARMGFITAVQWKEGTSGTAYYDREYAYTSGSIAVGADSNLIRPFQSTQHGYSAYKSTSTGDRVTTTMAETLYSGEVVPEKIVITYPAVVTAQNGSNSATTKERYFSKGGLLTWEKAEDGIITYREYTHGQLTKLIEDADTSETGVGEDFENVTIPGGLSSSGSPVHRVTTYDYDPQGRRSTTTEPDGRVHLSYYSKLADERLVSLSYNDYEAGTPKFHGPVRYSVSNLAGESVVQATVALASNESTTALTGHVDETDDDPITAMDLGSVVRLSTNHYNETGGTMEEGRLYFDIPTSGAGSDGTNYDPTLYGYDDMGRRTRTKAAHGTIDRTVYDIHGRVTEHWVGTNDSSFAGGEPSGTDSMVKTEALVYDAGGDDGNSHLTSRTLYVQGDTTGQRVTSYSYDPLGNLLLETRPTAPHAFHKVDGHGRTVATGLYSSTASITVGTDDPTTEATNRLALTRTYFDAKGQVWKTTRHEIDAADGSDDDNLESLHWYDATGRRIKTDGSQLTKTFYDRLGRQTHQFVLALAKNSGGSGETAYADADDVAYDIVLEEQQTVYESSDSDDVVMRVAISRFHDDLAGGTTGALDTNADGDDLLVTAANLEGRAQITAFWHDRFGRVTDTVRLGTNGGSNFDRDGLTVPARSDTELRTTNTYDTDGTVQDVTDPKALVARTLYDDAGRTVATIRNYVNGTPSGPTGDDDVFTRYTYVDGLRTEIWVDFDGDGTQDAGDQVTTYTYGTTKGVSAGDSKIATGHLLQETAYPDSASASDVVSMAYSAQSQELWKEDQAGNVFESEYDTSGRRTKLKITNVASGFDDAVERLQWAYTDLGQVETITSYDDPSSGSVVNEVKYAYDGWGNVTSFKQDKDGTVGGSGFHEVAYTWEEASTGRNTLRKTGATLPSGASLTYAYVSSAGRLDDAVSRVTQISHGATAVVQYGYNGLGQVVATDFRQPAIEWFLAGSSSGSYPDLDQFNRVTSSRWTSDLVTDVDFFDVDITYDRNSNITRVVDSVHVGFDWSYEMDGLDRLDRAERGTWSSGITSQQEDQTWMLDQVGNWDHVTLDFNADNSYGGTDEYDDDRTHNDVNELLARDVDNDSSDDYTLVYDGVGNLTDDGEEYKYVYDPLGRMRKILDRSDDSVVAEYRYNGLGHMIAVHEDTDTDGDVDASDVWFYPVHDERWRQVANFREDDSDPKEEWVNQDAGLDGRGGSSYINGVVLRDRDTDTAWTSASDGTLEERIFLCQNWRGDVSALVRADGDQVEQARYSPYGTPFGLPGGDCDSDGDCDATDVTQIQTWIDAPVYDIRGDVDLDGDLDASDKSQATTVYQGLSLGREANSTVANHKQYAAAVSVTSSPYLHARARNLSLVLGRWVTRDPLGQVEGASLYEYVAGKAASIVDAYGLCGTCWPDITVEPVGTSACWALKIELRLEEKSPGKCQCRTGDKNCVLFAMIMFDIIPSGPSGPSGCDPVWDQDQTGWATWHSPVPPNKVLWSVPPECDINIPQSEGFAWCTISTPCNTKKSVSILAYSQDGSETVGASFNASCGGCAGVYPGPFGPPPHPPDE
jgi:RHS repeat-associated protein